MYIVPGLGFSHMRTGGIGNLAMDSAGGPPARPAAPKPRPQRPAAKKKPVVISSDEEDDSDECISLRCAPSLWHRILPSTTIVLSVQHTALCFTADTDSSAFCHWPPRSDSEEDFSEPEDDSDFDEVNSPPTAKPKARDQLPAAC